MNLCCREHRGETERSCTGNEPRQSYCVMIDPLSLNLRSATLGWFRFTAKQWHEVLRENDSIIQHIALKFSSEICLKFLHRTRTRWRVLCPFLARVIRTDYFSPSLNTERDKCCSKSRIFAKYDISCHLPGFGWPSELALKLATLWISGSDTNFWLSSVFIKNMLIVRLSAYSCCIINIAMFLRTSVKPGINTAATTHSILRFCVQLSTVSWLAVFLTVLEANLQPLNIRS